MARLSLRQGLDRDVYTVIKKLEETSNDGRPFKSLYHAYEAIKRSNSHLSRQKKKPLEDSIDRVLQFRKEELEDSEDSEAAIEKAEAEALPKKTEDERFLLNRQMTKHWHTNPPSQNSEDTQRMAKKRRIQEDGAPRDGQPSGNETTPATTPKPNGAPKEDATVDKTEKAPPKKIQKPNRFLIETPSDPIRLGGVQEVEKQLSRDLRTILKDQKTWVDEGCRRARGILVSGPVACGKRSLVRSVAAQLELPIISISPCLSDPERMEKLLVEAVDEAMRLAPSIIFVERLEKYMAKHGSTAHSEHHERTVEAFERQMQRMRQELPPDSHVLAMATTSSITDIHPDVIQKGTFEETIQMKIPDLSAREDIFRVVAQGPRVSQLPFHELARITHGYVGADIDSIVTIATKMSISRQREAEEAAPDTTMTDGDQPHGNSEPLFRYAPTLEDFKRIIVDYVPLLRKEGFTVIPDVSWDQVGALATIREQLEMSIVGPIKTPDLYRGWGLSRPSGVILWGPPGCGKTLVAQAVANEAQASFILINGPELLNKYVGESERAVRELFQRARSSTPCILFFDEMDSLVPRRDGASSDAGVRVVNALLTELDGVQDRSGIYVIGTTNRPDMIDAAMLRPGRLSVRIFVDLPTEEERVEILRTIFRNLHSSVSEVELTRLEAVARDPRCSDFSGADLSGLHTKAAECGLRRWLRKEKTAQEIDEVDWEYALAHTAKSVLNPESYRKLDAKLGKEQ